MMNKRILITIFTVLCVCSVFAEEVAEDAKAVATEAEAKDPIIDKWKYKASILDFRADGSVDASFDDKTYRKWSKAEVERTYYFIMPASKLTVILSKDGNSINMVERKRTYKRLVAEKSVSKVKKLNQWQFFFRIEWDKVEQIRKCLEHQPELIKATEINNVTPLHRAKSKEMVEVLLSHDADLNAQDSLLATPLHYAYTKKEVASILITSGADLSIKNKAGHTPLIKAIREGSPDVVEAMLNAGGESLDEKEWALVLRSTKRPDMKSVVGAYHAKRKAKAAQARAQAKSEAKAAQAEIAAANRPPPVKLEETMVADDSATFKITDIEVADRKDILMGVKQSEKSLLSARDWESLQTLIAVTFELDIKDAEPGTVSTFMIKKIYVKVGRRKYGYIGLKLDSDALYQGSGISFHSDHNGKFSLPRKPKTTMYFLVPEGTPSIKLIFSDKVVDEARL